MDEYDACLPLPLMVVDREGAGEGPSSILSRSRRNSREVFLAKLRLLDFFSLFSSAGTSVNWLSYSTADSSGCDPSPDTVMVKPLVYPFDGGGGGRKSKSSERDLSRPLRSSLNFWVEDLGGGGR